ncbi:coiled-coil domain-containing protein 39-like [Chelonus insularis]|uniref:coiled-coil domain-containing protein 39-like n=1 Tax=Chelonus insularis TaxID=460826 RepID=UPI00158C79CF|nr:coiled-coil domain-containing protein 39-like [Chelonus insularis]
MKGSLKDILKDLGWDSGFRIPVANEENKQLEQEIEKKLQEKKELTQTLDKTNSRVHAIELFLKDIKVLYNYNQKLLTACVAQYEAENHFEKLSQHDESAIEKELRSLEKEKKDTQERIGSMTKEIKKLQENLECLKRIVSFNKHEILECKKILNRDEEHQQLIRKYVRLDMKKFKELDLKREKLTEELKIHKQAVIKVIDNICEKEVVLDRTAKFYTEALNTRKQLIERWTQSVLILRERDDDIQKIIKEIETLKTAGAEKLKILDESDSFMNNQISCNKELEYAIKNLEKALVLAKEKRNQVAKDIDEGNLEYKTQKRILTDNSYKIQNLQVEIKAMKRNITNETKKIDDWNKQIADMKATLNKVNNQSENVQDRRKKLESMIEKEKRRKFSLSSEIKRFQGLSARTMSKISDRENDRRMIELQEQGELKKIELLAMSQVKEEKRLQERKESAYKLDILIENCKIRLGKGTKDAGKDADELERKRKKIDGLLEALDKRNDVSKLLRNHMIKLENELKKAQSTLDAENNRVKLLKDKKQNLELMMQGGEKQLKLVVRLNEEKQVAKNILELKITQAEEMMRNTGSRVYNLEQCLLKICTAMKERIAELKMLREAFNLRNKLAINECSELRALINEKHYQTLHLQSRYDNIIATSNANITGDSLPATTYLKIQNAQYKYELQERGDKLDAAIRKTEQEIKSMENTLRVVNACNEKYKLSLGTAEDDSSKQIIQSQLDHQMFQALDELKRKKSQFNTSKSELSITEENYKLSLEDLEQMKEEKDRRHEIVVALEKQINDQKGRLSRADMRLKKLYKDIQRLCECANDDIIILQEKDIATREIEEQNLLGLQRLTEFTIRHVEAEVYVKKLIAAKNIILPCTQHIKPSSSPASLCESSRSSILSFNRNKKYLQSTESINRSRY